MSVLNMDQLSLPQTHLELFCLPHLGPRKRGVMETVSGQAGHPCHLPQHCTLVSPQNLRQASPRDSVMLEERGSVI